METWGLLMILGPLWRWQVSNRCSEMMRVCWDMLVLIAALFKVNLKLPAALIDVAITFARKPCSVQLCYFDS